MWANQLQLTISDIVAEAHDTHHPISTNKYYEDQRKEAKARAKDFREARIPKFLDYFEGVVRHNPGVRKAFPATVIIERKLMFRPLPHQPCLRPAHAASPTA